MSLRYNRLYENEDQKPEDGKNIGNVALLFCDEIDKGDGSNCGGKIPCKDKRDSDNHKIRPLPDILNEEQQENGDKPAVYQQELERIRWRFYNAYAPGTGFEHQVKGKKNKNRNWGDHDKLDPG